MVLYPHLSKKFIKIVQLYSNETACYIEKSIKLQIVDIGDVITYGTHVYRAIYFTDGKYYVKGYLIDRNPFIMSKLQKFQIIHFWRSKIFHNRELDYNFFSFQHFEIIASPNSLIGELVVLHPSHSI